MTDVGTIKSYPVKILDEATAKKEIDSFIDIIDEIPFVNYSEEDLLANSKDDRTFYAKWKHSLVVYDGKKPIAVIIGYERKSEENQQYPDNTLYISELAVDKDYQKKGIAKALIRLFLKYNLKKGFLHLQGKINFSVQTNSADWNHHVVNLYELFGFKKRSTKKYDNRTDFVLGKDS